MKFLFDLMLLAGVFARVDGSRTLTTRRTDGHRAAAAAQGKVDPLSSGAAAPALDLSNLSPGKEAIVRRLSPTNPPSATLIVPFADRERIEMTIHASLTLGTFTGGSRKLIDSSLLLLLAALQNTLKEVLESGLNENQRLVDVKLLENTGTTVSFELVLEEVCTTSCEDQIDDTDMYDNVKTHMSEEISNGNANSKLKKNAEKNAQDAGCGKSCDGVTNAFIQEATLDQPVITSSTGNANDSPSKTSSASPTTASPSKSPSASPTTARPSKSPSASPTTAIPSKSPSGSPTTGSPSKSPSASPITSSPSKSRSCDNRSDFLIRVGRKRFAVALYRTCGWVSKKPLTRCGRRGFSTTLTAQEACPGACDQACVKPTRQPTPCTGGDDEKWHFTPRKPAPDKPRGCNWVAKRRCHRCKNREGDDGRLASEACCTTCQTC